MARFRRQRMLRPLIDDRDGVPSRSTLTTRADNSFAAQRDVFRAEPATLAPHPAMRPSEFRRRREIRRLRPVANTSRQAINSNKKGKRRSHARHDGIRSRPADPLPRLPHRRHRRRLHHGRRAFGELQAGRLPGGVNCVAHAGACPDGRRTLGDPQGPRHPEGAD
jgi:hypothetical protein